MGFNQVVRSVGFSMGSAIGGLILAADTESRHAFPTDSGYTTAAWIGAALMSLTMVTRLSKPPDLREARSALHRGIRRRPPGRHCEPPGS
jgi:predicted MFS family arabinose efflux permease